MIYIIVTDKDGNTRGIYPETVNKKWLKNEIAYLTNKYGILKTREQSI